LSSDAVPGEKKYANWKLSQKSVSRGVGGIINKKTKTEGRSIQWGGKNPKDVHISVTDGKASPERMWVLRKVTSGANANIT